MTLTLPRTEAAFYEKQGDLVDAVLPFLEEWGIDMTWVNTSLLPARKKYEGLYRDCLDPLLRTRTMIMLKNEAWIKYQKLLALMVAMVKSMSGLTVEELAAKGIAANKGGTHKDKRPGGVPTLEFDLNTIRRILVKFGAKPEQVHEVEILVKVGGEKPVRVEDFDRSESCTHSPLLLEFKESERYQLVHLMARYKSETGKSGGWGEVYSVVIP